MHVRILSAAKCINATFYCKHWKTHCASFPGLHTPAFASIVSDRLSDRIALFPGLQTPAFALLVSDWLSDRIASFPGLLWLQFVITLKYPCLHTASNQKLEQECRNVEPCAVEKSQITPCLWTEWTWRPPVPSLQTWQYAVETKRRTQAKVELPGHRVVPFCFTEGIKLPYSKMAHGLDSRSQALPSFPSLVCT